MEISSDQEKGVWGPLETFQGQGPVTMTVNRVDNERFVDPKMD